MLLFLYCFCCVTMQTFCEHDVELYQTMSIKQICTMVLVLLWSVIVQNKCCYSGDFQKSDMLITCLLTETLAHMLWQQINKANEKLERSHNRVINSFRKYTHSDWFTNTSYHYRVSDGNKMLHVNTCWSPLCGYREDWGWLWWSAVTTEYTHSCGNSLFFPFFTLLEEKLRAA